MKLFSLKGGIELLDSDAMECVDGQAYLFYSFGKQNQQYIEGTIKAILGARFSDIIVSNIGEPFDYQVRMEFLDIKKELGEGGFGSVYLAYDKLLDKEIALKILNFNLNITKS